MSLLKNFSVILIIFSYLFVGDYYISDFPLFMLVWFIAIFYRMVFSIKFSLREVLIQIILTMVLSPLLLRGAYFGNQYELSILYALLFINIFPLLLFVLNDLKYRRYFLSISIFFLILTIFMYFLGIRSVVFGPNIFYRIVGFSYICFYVMSLIHKDIKASFFLITYLSTLTTALATQSRGALLLSVVLLCMTSIVLVSKSKYRYLFLFAFLFTAYLIYSNITYLSIFFGRSAYFDTNNASEATRLEFLSYIIDYYHNLSFNNFLLGLGYPNKYFYMTGYYPHNLFLELFISFGFLYFFVFIFLSLFSFLRMNRSQWLLLLVFSPIYFGSQFSGYFGDHSYLLLIPFIIISLSDKYSYSINSSSAVLITKH